MLKSLVNYAMLVRLITVICQNVLSMVKKNHINLS